MSDSDKALSITPGENVARDLADPHRCRDTMRMLAKAIRQSWDIPPEVFQNIPKQLQDIINNSDNARDKIRAIQTFVQMHKANVDGLIALDKIERLDAGTPTENVKVFQAEFDRQG